MKYNDVRDYIKTGDLLAWSEGGTWNTWRNWQLNLVRMGTMSDYNHVGIAYVADGRVFVVEAVVPEVRIYPLSKLLPFRYIRTPFTFSEENTNILLSHVGKPYSKLEAIKAAFTKDTNNDKVVQCAKLVNMVYGNIDKGYSELYDTPSAIVDYTLDSYNTQELRIV